LIVLRPKGWRVAFGRTTRDRPAAVSFAWGGLTLLSRRGMVWEHAVRIVTGDEESWIGGNHGGETMQHLRRTKGGIERATTLHRPDGVAIANVVTEYAVNAAIVTTSTTVTWLSDVEWTRRYVGMLPCAGWMTDVTVGGQQRTLGTGDVLWGDEPDRTASARGRGWAGRLEVDSPCVMSAHARRDGRTVKLYADVGSSGARAGDAETRTASVSFTRSPS
jgi:hypothetical protein